MRYSPRGWLFAAAAASFLIALTASADMALPPKMQASLLTKIFSYDSKLSSTGGRALHVLVAYQEADVEVKHVLDALREVGLAVYAVSTDEVADRIAGADVLYLMPDVNAAPLAELSARAGALSVSGAAGFAQTGQAAVGLGLSEEGRPQIVVNLAQLQREGHRFAPQFLTLTRVIR